MITNKPSRAKSTSDFKLDHRKPHQTLEADHPLTKKARNNCMTSEKLSKLKRIAKRKTHAQINPQVKKNIEFCQIHDLISDPEFWKVEDFSEDLIDSCVSCE